MRAKDVADASPRDVRERTDVRTIGRRQLRRQRRWWRRLRRRGRWRLGWWRRWERWRWLRRGRRACAQVGQERQQRQRVARPHSRCTIHTLFTRSSRAEGGSPPQRRERVAESGASRRGLVVGSASLYSKGAALRWCRALCEGHCGGPCRSGECMSVGPTPTAREDNALRGGGGRGRKGKGEDERCAGADATTKTRRWTAKSSNECRKHPWVKPPRAVGSVG